MTVVVPTLAADSALVDCLHSLEVQTIADFDVIVVDNSGQGRARELECARDRVTIIENASNVGFGAAVNQGYRQSTAPFLATLNDDAVAHPDWLKAMLDAIETRPDVGMCASQVRLGGESCLDSAGMLICRDGSSKQRGHREPVSAYSRTQHTLLPSGSAALYRREMLDEIGLFDESFFLYCEDTDLGLRARWAAWECLYVSGAVVEHRYSHSAGRASPLKAYYVERNRLFLVVKNFPMRQLLAAPLFALIRYFWHFALMGRNQGKAAEYRQDGHSAWELPESVARAHLALLGEFRRLWKMRRQIRRRLTPRQFSRLMRSHSISPRQVAAL